MNTKNRFLAITFGLMSIFFTAFCYQTVVQNVFWLHYSQYYPSSNGSTLGLTLFIILELFFFYAITAWNAVKGGLFNRRTQWLLYPLGAILWLVLMCGYWQARHNLRNMDLLETAQRGQTQIVQRLLAQGTDIEARNLSGMTPLMRAAEYGQLETVKLLLTQGANITARDESGMTAVTVAADQGQAEILDFLLRKGADVNAADKDGRTPLHWAAAFANHQTVQTLLVHGAHVNAQSKMGKTALMLAAGDREELGARGNAASVRVLLAAGADITLKDHRGDTAQTLAAKRGKKDAEKDVYKDTKTILDLLTPKRALSSDTPPVDDPDEEKSTANWP